MREIVDRTQKPTRRILARSENSKIGQCTLTLIQPPPFEQVIEGLRSLEAELNRNA
jgi:hypothetical protein